MALEIHCRHLFLVLVFVLHGSNAQASGRAPIVQANASQQVTPNAYDQSILKFTVIASDPESDPLCFKIAQFTKNGENLPIPRKMTIDSTTGAFSWTVNPAYIGAVEARIEVKDCAPTAGCPCTGNITSASANITVKDPGPCTDISSACTFVKTKYSQGLAAGNFADFYQNQDGNHAPLNLGELPQVDHLFNRVFASTEGWQNRAMIANSSTAYYLDDQAYSMSNTRYRMRSAFVATLYQSYLQNLHTWYPAHQDHTNYNTGINIDLFHAMVPFLSNSYGSSGSELDELKKMFLALAAFKPAVKARLRQEGLLMPILQMIMRRSRVASDAEYLSGKAHSNAFADADNTLKMVELAQAIDENTIPPIAKLSVVEDTFTSEFPKGHFDPFSERNYDSPVSISRIFRGREKTKRIRVRANESLDINNRPLRYEWIVLRGDTTKIRIVPLNIQKTQVDIFFDYHPESEFNYYSNGGTLEVFKSRLAVVGAFVHNGAFYSPPAFITSYTLPDESRIYGADGKISEIQYYQSSMGSHFISPTTLGYQKAWQKDVYKYEGSRVLLGWTRYVNNIPYEYNPNGMITSSNAFNISGHVRFKGAALAGSKVWVTMDKIDLLAQSDANGYFAIPARVRPGYYKLQGLGPQGYTLATLDLGYVGSNRTNADPVVSCASGFSEEGTSCVGGARFISGRISLGSSGLPGVVISVTPILGGSTIKVLTDANGFYTASNLPSAEYTVTPSSPLYAFTPASTRVSVVSGSRTDVSFSTAERRPAAPGNLKVQRTTQ